MTPTRGASRERRQSGMAGLAIILVLLVATTAALIVAPNFVAKATEKKRTNEEQRLEQIAQALKISVRLTGTIPGANTWPDTVAAHAGMNRTNAEAVYPEFPTDTSTRRVLLIDPALGATTLPYVQDVNTLLDAVKGVLGAPTAILGTITNLASSSGRIMLISSTRRGLSLPVTNGPASGATAFNNIWNWGLNSATKAPPTGWPSTWTGKGDELHVQRIKLNELFHTVALKNVLYAIGTNGPAQTALSLLNLTLLDTTLLTVYETNGNLYRAQRLTKNVNIDLSTSNSGQPVVHFKFSESSGAVATNSGTYGSSWNGIYTNSVLLAQTSLRPPSNPGFATNNYSAYFDGNKAYVETNKRYTNYLPAFTIATWIAPAQFSRSTIYIAGIRTTLNLNIYSSKAGSNYVRLSSKYGGSLTTHYPYPLNQWHHITVTGSGTKLNSYIDGAFKKSLSKATANYYYYNTYTFQIGAHPAISSGMISWGSSPQYKGGIDEFVFYDRVLSTNEIRTLATGVIP